LKALPYVDVIGKVKLLGHDAEDAVRRVVEADLLADDRGVGTVSAAPEAIADDGDELVLDEERPGLGEAGPDLGPDAEEVEEIAAHFHGLDSNRIESRVDEIDARPPPGGRVVEYGKLSLVAEVHGRDEVVKVTLSEIRVPDGYQTIRLAVRKRPENDGLENRIDRRRCADAESEDQDGEDGERGTLLELADGLAKGCGHFETPRSGPITIGKSGIPGGPPGERTKRRAVESLDRAGARIGIGESLRPRSLIKVLEMERELLGHALG
jgi:hypothetical protein